MGMQMRIAYVNVLGIPHADVDVGDSSTKTPCRNAYEMACCICLPPYVGLHVPSRKLRHCIACNGDIQVPDMLLGWFPGGDLDVGLTR